VADGFASALVELGTWDFDAVITDHDMAHPGTGVDLLAEVRERWPRMRRFLCTANTGEVQLALASGVAHHLLRKPIDRAALLLLLQREGHRP
jgi:CheY-like chemotaxis protein